MGKAVMQCRARTLKTDWVQNLELATYQASGHKARTLCMPSVLVGQVGTVCLCTETVEVHD